MRREYIRNGAVDEKGDLVHDGEEARTIGGRTSRVGAFGVFAYGVEQRRREIGVRMALGAQAPQVVWTVVGGARWPLLLGLGAGLLLSSAAAPLLRRFLYGLTPFDASTYLTTSAIPIAAALVATWVPAQRAIRIDPAITLRAD